jgi:hypothetical protein
MSPGLTRMVLRDLPGYVPETYLGMSLRLTCMVPGEIRGWEKNTPAATLRQGGGTSSVAFPVTRRRHREVNKRPALPAP